MEVKRFEVYWVNLEPSFGNEIRKVRPCAVVSPNEMNRHVRTVIVAPMTTKGRGYPSRVDCKFRGKSALIVLDQIRSIDKSRLQKKLGVLSPVTQSKVIAVLQEMFAV